MQLLALIYHYLIPHFATSHYLHATRDGHAVIVVLEGPEDVEEAHRRHVISASYLVLFGFPLFIRRFTYE